MCNGRVIEILSTGSDRHVGGRLAWQLVDDVAKASNVASTRFLVHKLSTDRPGIRAHLTIFESRAGGSGLPDIEPQGAIQLAHELIKQVGPATPLPSFACLTANAPGKRWVIDWRAQGSDPNSKLRFMRPAVVKVEIEGKPPGSAPPVQSVSDHTDLMRNFMTELDTLTFFIQANHDDDLLFHYSRVVQS